MPSHADPQYRPTKPAPVFPSGRTTIARLNQEWENLSFQPATWVGASLEVVLIAIRDDPDPRLLDLVRACQAGHHLAGRVIIQALLPKLILLARAYPFPTLDHLLAALWLRILAYPLGRRPRAVAANLVLDTRKDVVKENRTAPIPASPESDPAEPTQGPSATTVIATARAHNLASRQSLSIVEKVYVDGLPGYQVARRFAISEAAVRQRCSATIRRLRSHRALLAELAD